MPRLYFTGWDRPLLHSTTDHLTAGWHRGTLDLSSVLVLVPASQAGRLLRESLARRAAQGQGGVLAPLILTPAGFLDYGAAESGSTASPADSLLAWMQVLQEAPPDSLSAVFPVEPVARDAAWAQHTAAALLRMRSTLEEGGLGIAQAAESLGLEHPDADRWAALDVLEASAERVMAAAGLTDRLRTRMADLANPVLPQGLTRIVVAGVADPMELVLATLRAHEAAGIPVDVLIAAPPDEAGNFDAWGRPDPMRWVERIIDIADPVERIQLVARPEDEAAALLEHIRQGGGGLALGTADPAVAGPLTGMAASAGCPVFDPSGTPLLRHELLWLLTCLRDVLHSDSFHTAGLLLRIPDVLRTAVPGVPPMAVLRTWDDLSQRSMPRTMDSAAALLARQVPRTGPDGEVLVDPAATALTWLRAEIACLSQVEDNSALTKWLESIYEGRTFSSLAERQDFLAAIGHWQDAVESVDRAARRSARPLSAAARLDIALHLVRDVRLFPENELGLQEICGWLELPWQDAPDLVLAGMNEGMVPSSITSDPWLPDSTRVALHLRTNAARLARDTYLLTLLLQTRRQEGCVTLLAARETSSGEPLKPSRLLLRCPEDALPGRALQLFPVSLPENGALSTPAWHRAWQLAVPGPPPEARAFTTLSVTQFTDYLRCPFRCYLKHVLRMDPFDAHPDEKDARGVGNLIHDAMQSVHEEPDLRDSADAESLADFLHEKAAQLIYARHGRDLTVPLLIQLESARNRLRTIARIQAGERLAGWRVYQVEVTFPDLPGSNQKVTIDGMEIRGRIDLIERHTHHGLRVLDYKTAANAKRPFDHHLQRTNKEIPDWQAIDIDGKPMAWTNLQLPLYAWIVGKISAEPVSVCYFNAPRALTKTEILTWPITKREIDSAVACATSVVRCIREGRFWPPAKIERKFDDFKDIWFQDIVESFDPALLEKFRELQQSSTAPS